MWLQPRSPPRELTLQGQVGDSCVLCVLWPVQCEGRNKNQGPPHPHGGEAQEVRVEGEHWFSGTPKNHTWGVISLSPNISRPTLAEGDPDCSCPEPPWVFLHPALCVCIPHACRPALVPGCWPSAGPLGAATQAVGPWTLALSPTVICPQAGSPARGRSRVATLFASLLSRVRELPALLVVSGGTAICVAIIFLGSARVPVVLVPQTDGVLSAAAPSGVTQGPLQAGLAKEEAEGTGCCHWRKLCPMGCVSKPEPARWPFHPGSSTSLPLRLTSVNLTRESPTQPRCPTAVCAVSRP